MKDYKIEELDLIEVIEESDYSNWKNNRSKDQIIIDKINEIIRKINSE